MGVKYNAKAILYHDELAAFKVCFCNHQFIFQRVISISVNQFNQQHVVTVTHTVCACGLCYVAATGPPDKFLDIGSCPYQLTGHPRHFPVSESVHGFTSSLRKAKAPCTATRESVFIFLFKTPQLRRRPI